MLTRMKLTRCPLAFVALAIFLSCFSHAQDAAARAKQSGELISLKNHRVLRLFGATPKERGFAHGYLLAEDIRDDLDGALTSLPKFGAQRYETKLLPGFVLHLDEIMVAADGWGPEEEEDEGLAS